MSEKTPRYRHRAELSTGAPIDHRAAPAITGSVAATAQGVFTALAESGSGPWELRVEVSDHLGTTYTLTIQETVLADIIDEINAQYAGIIVARANGRRLTIAAASATGAGSWIRILPPASGDTTFLQRLGFVYNPHPRSISYGDELAHAPVRIQRTAPSDQGTAMVLEGEERSAGAFNRAIATVAQNTDILYTALNTSRPVPIVVSVTGSVADRLILDADGFVDQIDLSLIEGPVFHGSPLTYLSGKNDLARFFAVLDASGLPVRAWRDGGTYEGSVEPVRVGMITRGQRTGSAPTFYDDNAPDPEPLQTSGADADGYAAGGVSWTRCSGVEITEILGQDTLYCADATFTTWGVVSGDILTIAGSTQTAPFNNDGTYLVADVVSETVIRVIPYYAGDVGVLNASTETGALGEISVQAGEFNTGLYITLDPPMPLPADMSVGFQVVVCVPDSPLSYVGDNSGRYRLPVDATARDIDLERGLQSALNAGSAMEVSDAIQFWSRTHDGSETGPGEGVTSGTGSLRTGWVLRSDTSVFVPGHVGRVVRLTGGLFLGSEVLRVVAFIDGAHVRLQPLATRLRDNVTGPITVTWSLLDTGAVDLPVTLQINLPIRTGAAPDAHPFGGIALVREQDDISGTGVTTPGLHGYGYYERVRRVGTTNVMHLSGTFNGTDTVLISTTALDTANNILPEDSAEGRASLLDRGGMLVRVLNGSSAGWYRLSEVDSSAHITLKHLDGSTPTLAVESGITPILALYRLALGGPTLLAGSPTSAGHLAGLVVDIDGGETGVADTTGLRVRWRGAGRGIYITGNDDTFSAISNGRGADGWGVEVVGYTPLKGLKVQVDGQTGQSVAARRRARGGVFDVTSDVMNLDDAASVSPWRGGGALSAPDSGYALRVHQSGHDAALLVTRGNDRTSVEPVYPTGAMAFMFDDAGRNMTHRGHWAGLSLVAPIYQRDVGQGSGIITESGVGSGRFNHPTYPLYIAPTATTHRYDTPGVFSDHQQPYAPTLLGSPGQVWPFTSDTPVDYEYSLTPADYATFNVPHQAVAVIFPPEADNSLAFLVGLTTGRFIGMRLQVSGGAGGNGFYRIVAIHTGDSENQNLDRIQFALEQETGAALIGTTYTPTSIKILGERWYQSHIDMADWIQLGTSRTTDRAAIPLLFTSPSLTGGDHPTYSAYQGSLPENVREAGTISEASALSGAAVGHTLQPWTALADLAGVAVAPGSYTSGWQTDAQEAASPFPDASIIARVGTGNELLSAAGADGDLYGHEANPDSPHYLASLRLSDVVFEQVSGSGKLSMAWSNRWGGCLCIGKADGEPPPSGEHVVAVHFRGGNAVLTDSALLRVRLTLALAGGSGSRTESITVRLRDNADSAVLSSATQSVTFVDETPQDVEISFSAADLRRRPVDATDDRSLPFRWELRITDLFGSVTSSHHRWYILRASIHNDARTTEISGPLRTGGAVLAADFRTTSPRTTFSAISPHDASLLDGVEYGKVTPNGWNEGQEGVPMVGLLRRDSDSLPWEPVLDVSRIFRRSRNKATVVMQSIWNDPLAYAMWGTGSVTGVLRYPGPTGFVIPLRPTHGAVMTAIDLSLSFRAALSSPNSATGGQTNFNVWHTLPLDESNTLTEWRTKATWDGVEGVRIRLWRGACWERGTPAEIDADFPGTEAAPYGYVEQIAETTVDLSLISEPDGIANNEAGLEYHVPVRLLLSDATSVPLHHALVDLRVFYYVVTIEFWAGMRQVSSGGVYYELNANESSYLPTLSDVRSSGVEGKAVLAPHTWSFVTDGDKVTLPPAVSFRGGRVVMRTDRVG